MLTSKCGGVLRRDHAVPELLGLPPRPWAALLRIALVRLLKGEPDFDPVAWTREACAVGANRSGGVGEMACSHTPRELTVYTRAPSRPTVTPSERSSPKAPSCSSKELTSGA